MKYIFTVISIISLIGCSAHEVIPGSEKVFLTTKNAPKSCKFIKEINGSQGNFWTADITSDENLIQGARNDLRNKAYKIGANYVVIESQNQSLNSGFGGTYNSSIFGNAYSCPNI